MTPWWIDSPTPGRLAVCPRPRGGDWLEDDLRALRAAGVDILVSALMSAEEDELDLAREASLAIDTELHFVRLPTTDFGVPHLGDVAEPLLDLHAQLQAVHSVAVHCRMGVGRSPLIAASLLVATGIEADDAWRRVETARGLRVPDTEAQRQWVVAWAEWLAAEGALAERQL